MHEHVTLLPPETRREEGGLSSSLPPDLLEQVRGRVRLLSMLILIAFAFDPVLYVLAWSVATVAGVPLTAGSFARTGFMALSAGAAGASALLWWAAGNRRVSETRLHTLGLVYEVAICFVMAVATFWQFYLDNRTLPNLTWVPAVVILFPLILPGPPRRMLAAAMLAAAMPPLALLLLELSGKVATDAGDYVDLVISGAFAVAFAYMGARVVYRLGREVVAARYQAGEYLSLSLR